MLFDITDSVRCVTFSAAALSHLHTMAEIGGPPCVKFLYVFYFIGYISLSFVYNGSSESIARISSAPLILHSRTRIFHELLAITVNA
jgi:hypothetical protein